MQRRDQSKEEPSVPRVYSQFKRKVDRYKDKVLKNSFEALESHRSSKLSSPFQISLSPRAQLRKLGQLTSLNRDSLNTIARSEALNQSLDLPFLVSPRAESKQTIVQYPDPKVFPQWRQQSRVNLDFERKPNFSTISDSISQVRLSKKFSKLMRPEPLAKS